MKKLSSQSQGEKRCNYDKSVSIKFGCKFKAHKVPRFAEVFVLCSSDSCGSARITPGTLSGPNHPAIANAQPLNFIGVDIPAVISPRGLSGKSVMSDPGWKMNNIHSESRINFGDFLPTNGDLLHRINDHKSFIREDNFGVDEYKIEQHREPQTPDDAGQPTLKPVVQDIYVGKSANCKIGGKSEKIAASRSEVFDIAHMGIISRTYGRVA